MVDLLEAVMIFCWGLSWPVNIHKAYVSRTARGRSILFEVFIWLGYICGISRKILLITQGADTNWLFYLSFVFYIINITEVTIDMLLYRRNKKLDEIADLKAAKLQHRA